MVRIARVTRSLLARLVTVASLGAALVLVAGCGGTPARTKTPPPAEPVRRTSESRQLSPAELQELCYAFADRFSTYLINADVEINRMSPEPRQSLVMNRIKTFGSTAVYDIVTSGDPLSQLLDLVLYVTLQSYIWIDEGEAVAVFGDRAGPLITQLREARLDVWKVAARALTPQQLEALDNMILRWRRENSALDYLAFVRFDDVAAAGAVVERDVRSGGGLLAPISEVVDVAEKARMLGERTFWMSKRAPMILNWKVDDVVNGILSRAEVREALAATTSLAESADRASRVVEALPATIASEREKILAEVEQAQGSLRQTMADATGLLEVGRSTIADGERLLGEVRTTVEAVERTIGATSGLLDKLAPKEGAAPSEPLTREDYLRLIGDVTRLVQEVNLVLANSQGLLETDAWQRRLDQVNEAAELRVEQASQQTRGVVEFAAWAAGTVIAGFFAMLILYRVVAAILMRRLAPR